MLLQLHPGLMIWTVITFGILLIVLRIVAWGPILKLLKAREDKIRSDLETAENNRKETEENLAKIRAQLDLTRKEANDIIAEARGQAEKVKDDILASARADSEKLVERAKQEIQLERDKTVLALKDQFAELAVSAASQIIGETLSPDAHAKIIRKTIGDIK